jgi:hypothetical protein
MNNFGDKVSFIWSIADLIRDTFKRGKYQDVILPFTVLRRFDCVLEPTKEEVWLSWVWWVKCILRYILPSEGVERTTKTQRTQRLINPM